MIDLDLFHEERTLPKYRGPIREAAEQLVLGRISLNMFVERVRSERLRDALDRHGLNYSVELGADAAGLWCDCERWDSGGDVGSYADHVEAAEKWRW